MLKQLKLFLVVAGTALGFACSGGTVGEVGSAQPIAGTVDTVAGFVLVGTGEFPTLGALDGRDMSGARAADKGIVSIYRIGEEKLVHSTDDRGYFEIDGLSLVGDERILFDADGYRGVDIDLAVFASDKSDDGRIELLVELLPGGCQPPGAE